MSLKPRILLFQLYLHFFCTNFEFLEYHAKNDVSVGLHSWLLSPENYCYDLSVVNYHSLNKYLSCLNLELECILIKILENWNIYECPFTKGFKWKLFWKRIFDKFGKSFWEKWKLKRKMFLFTSGAEILWINSHGIHTTSSW